MSLCISFVIINTKFYSMPRSKAAKSKSQKEEVEEKVVE